jgi:hypothetical protein
MYGSNRTVSYPLVDNLPAGAIGWKTMGSDWIGSKSFDQTKSARVIEREALNAGLPAEIAAAMLVNAMAESYLDPKVKGDLMDAKKRFPKQKGFDPSTARYRSIGLFQLYETGVGKGMTVADRQDPVKNTRKIIEELWDSKSRQPVGGARPDYRHEHPIKAWERGVRDIGHLSDMFAIYVEGARWRRHADGVVKGRGHEGRMKIAHRLFPHATARTTLPAPGASLPYASASRMALTKGTTPPPSTGEPGWIESILPGPLRGWWRGDTGSAPTSAPTRRGMATWSASSPRFSLIASDGSAYQAGSVPAGSYKLGWDGVAATSVNLAAGFNYRAWTEGRTVNFARA